MQTEGFADWHVLNTCRTIQLDRKKGTLMVDNRAAGFYGIGGSFNFKSGDISGTTAGMSDDKMGQGNEYSRQDKKQEESLKESTIQFTDRSAQLRATLNSLAMINVAGVINTKKRPARLNDEQDESFDEHEFYLKTRKKRKELLLENSLVDEDDITEESDESEKQETSN